MNQVQTQIPSNQTQTTSSRNLLTDKELHYIKDYLSWELLAMKKCHDAASRCTDTNIQNVLKDIGKNHQQHYENLLNQLP